MGKWISGILFILNMSVVFLSIENLNLFTFFLFVIICPAILFAICTNYIIRNVKSDTLQITIASALFVFIILAFSYFRISDSALVAIAKNTAVLTQNIAGLTVTNLDLDFSISSFVMLFLLEFILIKLLRKVMEKNFRK